jgi:hypothetical protein
MGFHKQRITHHFPEGHQLVLIHHLTIRQLLEPEVAIVDNLIGYGTDGLGHLNKLSFVYLFCFHVYKVLVNNRIFVFVFYLIGLIINNVYNGDDEHYDTHDGDDAIDTRSSKEGTDLLEKTAKQFEQSFEDAADKGDDECNDSDDDKHNNKELFHVVLF